MAFQLQTITIPFHHPSFTRIILWRIKKMIDIFFLIFFSFFFPFLETITTCNVFIIWKSRIVTHYFIGVYLCLHDMFVIRLLVFNLQSFYEEKREDADILFSNLIIVIFFHDKPSPIGSWIKKYGDYSWWFSHRRIVRERVRFSWHARFASYMITIL